MAAGLIMARVRFTADFDYRPTKSITIAYKTGMEETVRRDCALKAISEGKAVELIQDKENPDGKKPLGWRSLFQGRL